MEDTCGQVTRKGAISVAGSMLPGGMLALGLVEDSPSVCTFQKAYSPNSHRAPVKPDTVEIHE